MPSHDPPRTENAVRQELAGLNGKEYWRTLAELADSREFQELLEREAPQQAAALKESPNRRQFLQLLGASLALAGVGGCMTGAPREQILPYVRQPEEITPGESLFFATSMPLAGYASGLLVESHMGRPTKIEGNPQHPANPQLSGVPANAQFGPTSVFAQAAVLGLYDPSRSQTVKNRGRISTFERCLAAIDELFAEKGGRRSVKLRLLTGAVTSPTLANQVQTILRNFHQARWHVHESAGNDNSRAGHDRAFDATTDVRYRFDRADVILSLEADFLSIGPDHVYNTGKFAERRRGLTAVDRQKMSRLYVVESMPSLAGAKADHRWPLASSKVAGFARDVAAALGVTVPGDNNSAHGISASWITALVNDLRAARQKSIVVAGESQPPFVHALAMKMNQELGNIGNTVIPSARVEARDNARTLPQLVEDIDAGDVDILLVLGCNPVYTAPADVDIAAKLSRVPLRVHLGLYDDETAARCHWHIPEAHFLESWGDARAFDGTVSMIQPLIAPIYGGKSQYEVLAHLTGQEERSSYEIVRSYWRSVVDAAHPRHQRSLRYWRELGLQSAFRGSFSTWWRRALHEGFVAGTTLPAKSIRVRDNWHEAPRAVLANDGSTTLEINFRPDPTIFDGRLANNGWLQELPKPLTKLTWGNAAFMSPKTAADRGLSEGNGKVVELRYRGRSLEAPVWILPGHADEAVTVHLGGGRTHAGSVGTGVGFNAYNLRTSRALWFDNGLSLRPTNRQATMATTQTHHLINSDRHLIWSDKVQQFDHLVGEMRHHQRLPLSLNPPVAYDGNKWGMAIDLSACTGCSACVTACQSENNIPVVGKDQVSRGREMHWIRIDTYYKGDPETPANLETYHQPVACMHCENAPCELVCPVEATVHSSDGLNDMVYNRCVGTRYCSNNCPYKVRRFNFYQYADFDTEVYRFLRNPEVTTRTVGVMEKCTYCVQRIRKNNIAAVREDRSLRDFDIQTACQSACPAGAIVFGDLNMRDSKVTDWQGNALSYGLLEDHNTQPRTNYLAALRNPNPVIR